MNVRPTVVAAVVAILLVVGVIALFTIQNSGRSTQLSLDLAVAAWQLKQEVSIPALMAVCFGAGAVVPTAWFGVGWMNARSKARRLESELALAGGTSSDGWR